MANIPKFHIIKFKHDPISLLHLLFFSACDGAVRGDVISILQGKATSRLVYILPGMFIFHPPYKRNYIIMFVNAIEVKKNLFPYFIQQNPNPNYEETLHCTQEAVYPLYTMIFIFYALCGILMLLVRPLLSSKVIMM